jgi:hypothetical protein
MWQVHFLRPYLHAGMNDTVLAALLYKAAICSLRLAARLDTYVLNITLE